MLYKKTKDRNTKRRWTVGTLAMIAAILLSSWGTAVSQVSAQTPTPIVFRVDANGNITANGVAFRIKGGSWFGLQGRHEPSNDQTNPSGAPMEQYMGNVFWQPSSRTYDQDVAEFKAMGINVVRLPLSPQTLNASDPQGMAPNLKNTDSVKIANSRLALETVIKKLDAAGIYVLLDIHSCSNYVDWRKGRLDARPPYVDATRDNYDFKREDSSCSATNNPASVTRIQAYDETKWLADLTTLANMESSLGVSNIIGIDIFNEPWDYTWAEWKTLTEHAYTAINAVNPNILIFSEGVSATAGNQDGSPTTITQVPYGGHVVPNWGGNFFEASANPPNIPKNRLVFSPHVYGPSVFVGKQFADPAQPACANLEGDAFGDAHCNIVINPTLLRQGWEDHWGYLKALGYGVVIGEWGGNMDWPHGKASLRDQARFGYLTDNTTDQQWQNAFADYLISKGIADTIYWSINPESGDTGGLYTTPYDPVSNTGGWGTWGALDSRKMTLVQRLWNVPVVTGPTPHPNHYTYSDSDRNQWTYEYADSDADPNCYWVDEHTYSDTNCDRRTDKYADPDTNRDCYWIDKHPNSDANPHSDTGNADKYANPNPNPHTNTDSHPRQWCCMQPGDIHDYRSFHLRRSRHFLLAIQQPRHVHQQLEHGQPDSQWRQFHQCLCIHIRFATQDQRFLVCELYR